MRRIGLARYIVTMDHIAAVASGFTRMRMQAIDDAIRDAMAMDAEALDAWHVFDGTTFRVFTKVTTLDAPPSHPEGVERFILKPQAARPR